MVTTKRAPVGLNEPVERSFKGVLKAYTSEVYRSAVRTARWEETSFGKAHRIPPAFVMTRDGVVTSAGPTLPIGLVPRAITVATATVATIGASKEMPRSGNRSPSVFRFARWLVAAGEFVLAASAMVFS